MDIKLVRATINDAKEIWKMQVESFSGLLSKYQDYEISPANEQLEKVEMRLRQEYTYFYFIVKDDKKVGGIRIVDGKPGDKNKRISPLFILPQYRGCGVAKSAIRLCEEIHGKIGWELDTILQEEGNCHLYEKMGYKKTGEVKHVKDGMDLVYYSK